MRRLGDGVDWSRERSPWTTGCPGPFRRSQALFDDDLIYRAGADQHWCRAAARAVDIEVDHSEDEGELVSVRYGSDDGSIVVATTRVRRCWGTPASRCTRTTSAISTWSHEIELPIVGRMIPVVADEQRPTRAFGTGAVEGSPRRHDPNDFEIGARHGLPTPSIMERGRGHFELRYPVRRSRPVRARAAVREELRAQGRIVAEKRPYLHSVGTAAAATRWSSRG